MTTPADRDAYIETLVDDALKEADDMENDFTGWLERQAPRWRALGRDETWIRLRVETAQATRQLNRLMKAQGRSEVERRRALRTVFAGMPPAPKVATAAKTPKAAPPTPQMLQAAIMQLGKDMGATIFEINPTIHREKFMASVELLIQQEFGVTPQQRSLVARDTLYTIAAKEYERLGGTFAEETP